MPCPARLTIEQQVSKANRWSTWISTLMYVSLAEQHCHTLSLSLTDSLLTTQYPDSRSLEHAMQRWRLAMGDSRAPSPLSFSFGLARCCGLSCPYLLTGYVLTTVCGAIKSRSHATPTAMASYKLQVASTSCVIAGKLPSSPHTHTNRAGKGKMCTRIPRTYIRRTDKRAAPWPLLGLGSCTSCSCSCCVRAFWLVSQ
ncbi:uncharacterized protein K452DRAFT_155644 [Aplosporella prunicola CBS 121167]|uniref:Uncharacterized protein n=1 Tax=Aplosporella prunicola CBS 121167 TaxID=1176127 RepID=A0A6A6BJH0_9PEZI|nr:uncharacterized protein K452DRAFT_155644 [Aplosporella prunicola CBS 121167]KAF2144262.1 hypothetical protein K452DRAFT_155644 [Aplosporella prunicola CBS 121167]